ncbi:MAG TPA: prenyltransferase/squalene oxidase repeat-containing protein [Micromonosporaceae bacterium]
MTDIAHFTIDLVPVRTSLDRSLNLLERSFLTAAGGVGGGWYHELAGPSPGPTATAVGLLAFHLSHRTFDRSQDCLTFLGSRQVSSTIASRSGGWSTNASPGHPIVESTGWVVRMLAECRHRVENAAVDIGSAVDWLVFNQNKDGGWGSLVHNTSRVWTTCLALRALIRIDPSLPVVTAGIRWLMRQQHPEGGWGQTCSQQPNVTHTAKVLITLQESGLADTDSAVVKGYEWLDARLDRTFEEDRDARVEMYDIGVDEPPQRWRSTIPHYGLPYALIALLEQPTGPRPERISSVVHSLLATQLPEGRWPNVEGGQTASMWSVYPHMEALARLMDWSPLRPGDKITLLPDVVVVQHSAARGKTLSELFRPRRGRAIREALVRNWTSLALTVAFLVGLVGVITGRFDWNDFSLGLAVPIVLFVIQEVRERRRAGKSATARVEPPSPRTFR